MSKNKKIPAQLAKNASKLHRRVGDLLMDDSSPYKRYIIRQEVRVSDINPEFSSNRERFDWVILEPIRVVIEVMGIQHTKPARFGGISEEEARRIFKEQQERDEAKKQAAIDAGWGYIAISYKEHNITIEDLVEYIKEAIKNRKDIHEVNIKEKPKQKIESTQKQWPKHKLKSKNKLKSKSFPRVKKKIWNPKNNRSK